MSENPYQSPLSKSTASSSDARLCWLSAISVMCALVPPLIVIGVLMAFVLGFPPPTAFIRTLIYIVAGAAGFFAFAIGVAAMFVQPRVVPALSAILGVIEVVVLLGIMSLFQL